MPLISQASGIMLVALLSGVVCNASTVLTGSTFEEQAGSDCDGSENCRNFDMVDLVQVHTTVLNNAIALKLGHGRSAAIVQALSLFQKHFVDASRGKQVGMPDLSGLHQSMAQLVSESMDRKEAVSDTETDALDAIVAQMNLLLVDMPVRRDAAQDSLDEKRQAIVNCVDGIHRQSFATHKSNAVAKKNNHTDCRMDEWNKKNVSEEKHAVLAGLVDQPLAPACMTDFSFTVGQIDSLLTCVGAISLWADGYLLSLTQAKNESDAALLAYELKTPTCHHLQSEYESQFCSYRALLDGSCAEYTACYTRTVDEEAAEVPKVQTTEEQIKIEYTSVQRILCLVNVLQANQTEQQGQLDGCLSATYPTGDLDISYNATVPAKASCDTSDVAIHPCVPAWEENEYTSTSWSMGGVAAAECVPCAE